MRDEDTDTYGNGNTGEGISESERRLRKALTEIARAAQSAIGDGHDGDDEIPDGSDGSYEGGADEEDGHKGTDFHPCAIRTLPKRLLEKAADAAIKINPLNAPHIGPVGLAGLNLDRLRIAVLVSKYWGNKPRQLTVSFMDNPPKDLRTRILSHMNAWNRMGCGISFVETNGVGNVRIARAIDGYWSYLGTDILHIPQNEPTMNLESFTMNTPESEYKRVVRHETGHTLGFPHEHMRKALVDRIDPKKAYDYFWRTQRWDKRTVDQQVLTSLDEQSLMKTPPDQDSIMCYQLPASIMKSNGPIRGGIDINPTDGTFAAGIYSKTAAAAPSQPQDAISSQDASRTAVQRAGRYRDMWDYGDAWPESEDVEVSEDLLA